MLSQHKRKKMNSTRRICLFSSSLYRGSARAILFIQLKLVVIPFILVWWILKPNCEPQARCHTHTHTKMKKMKFMEIAIETNVRLVCFWIFSELLLTSNFKLKPYSKASFQNVKALFQIVQKNEYEKKIPAEHEINMYI